jgi:hypothetical protein
VNIFFWRSKSPNRDISLSPEQIALEIREQEESNRSAIPDAVHSDSFGEGSFINNISKVQMTTLQNGMGAVAERRIFEPRKFQEQDDQETL